MNKEFYLTIEGHDFELKDFEEYVIWVKRFNEKLKEKESWISYYQLYECTKIKRKTYIMVSKSYLVESKIGGIDNPVKIELTIYVDLKEKRRYERH